MALNNIRIEANFLLKEFESPDTREVKVDNVLLVKLQELRHALNKPIKINSGYRTPEHNISVGGAKKSRHLFGRAVDISTKNLDVNEVIIKANAIGFYRVLPNYKKHYVHLAVSKK